MACEHIYRCLTCGWIVRLKEALLPSESPCPICSKGKLAYITTETAKE
jgi:rubrerythrin